MSSVSVPKLYRSVIEDVIAGVRDMFLDDGVDEQVLIDLKQTWYKKVEETKALVDENNKDKGGSATGGSSNSNSTTLSTTTTITPATRPVTSQQPQVTQVIASNQARHITTGSSGLSTQTSITQVITTNQSRTLNSGGSSSFSQPTQINQVITSNQPRTLTTIGTTLPQQTQITPVIATNQARHITSGGSTLPQQLNFPTGSVIPHTVLQFPSGDRIDGSKSVPGKFIFLNAQASGLMSSPATTASLALPPELANSLLQQAAPVSSGGVINIQSMQPQELVVRHTNNPTTVINGPTTIQFQPASTDQRATRPAHSNSSGGNTNVVQLDGPNDNSSDDDDDDDEFRDNDDDHEDDDNDQNDDENEYTGEEEVSVEPLNSEDDVSDEDPHELFDTDNVVVCLYDKITRSRNKWKFHLRDGIMNLQGKDYVFQKAIGDAEW